MDQGAHDHGRAFHVSNDKPTDKHVIARAYKTAAADVRQHGVNPWLGNFVNLGQANSLGSSCFR